MKNNPNNKKLSKIIVLLLGIIVVLLLAFAFLLGKMSGQKDAAPVSKTEADKNSTETTTAEEIATTEAVSDIQPKGPLSENTIRSSYIALNGNKLYWCFDNTVCVADTQASGALSDCQSLGTMTEDVSSIAFSDSQLYINSKDGLYRADTGSFSGNDLLSSATRLIDVKYIADFCVTEDAIYYSRANKLFQTDLNGQNENEILSGIKDFFVSGKEIYYLSAGGVLHRKEAGTSMDEILLETAGAEKILLQGNDIYLKGTSLQLYHADSNTAETLSLPYSPDFSHSVLATDDFILYKTKAGNYARYYPDTQEKEIYDYAFFEERPYSVTSGNYHYYCFRNTQVTIVNLDTLEYEHFDAEESSNTTSKPASTETGKSASTETGKTDGNASGKTSGKTSGYNIAANLQCRITDGFGLAESDYFSLVFPYDDFANNRWVIEPIDNNTIAFYYDKAKNSDYGGWVFSISAYDWGDNSYSELPDYTIADTSSEKKYIAIFPTDVQFDYSDSTQAKEYGRMLEFARNIDSKKDSNPFSAR